MIYVGAKLTLALAQDDFRDRQPFTTEIVDIHDQTLHIEYPVNPETGKPEFLFTGTECIAKFLGKDEAVYTFRTEVTGRGNEQAPVLHMSYPGDDQLMKIQRRKFLRVPAELDVSVRDSHQTFSPFTTKTVDLSGGGLAIETGHTPFIQKGSIIHVWLVLPFKSNEYHYINARAKVVRIFYDTDENETVEYASLQFTDIIEQDQQEIIRYCFEKQLEKRGRKYNIRNN
ncbi:flagellar brake protein [Salirhabdus salicampi]|uniref:flagellar brake protein n=1 Tax=Salirhabdus salicampi TaxID=476102 RepID=UPI0020C2215D|nr:PilZ domain-containing protein [Salirhabdus salicampi]MCP8616718.1 PilZ domain-containing protein [Salirhabdus salicampi]